MSDKVFTTSEKIKKFINKKMLLGFASLLMGVAIIFVCSVVPLAIQPDKWGSASFISDEMILIALTILGEVCLIMMGQSYNGSQDVSNIARATVKFNVSLEENIGDKVTAFDQWVKQKLEPSDQKDKYHRLLTHAGLENTRYLDLPRNELKELLKHPDRIEGIYYRQLSKQQYHLIMNILDGKETIDFVDPSTYRKLSKLDNDKNTSEKMANQQKKKSSAVAYSIITKSLIVVCSGLIFGALVPTGAEQSIGETLLKLFTRLFCFSSAGFVGFFVGCQINDIDAEYINEKTDTHKRYHGDTDFKPLTEQELAHQEYLKYKTREVADENQKLMNNSDRIAMQKGDSV